MSRPSNKEFIKWSENDSNVSKIQSALKAHSDLVNVKDDVSLNICFFVYWIVKVIVKKLISPI